MGCWRPTAATSANEGRFVGAQLCWAMACTAVCRESPNTVGLPQLQYLQHLSTRGEFCGSSALLGDGVHSGLPGIAQHSWAPTYPTAANEGRFVGAQLCWAMACTAVCRESPNTVGLPHIRQLQQRPRQASVRRGQLRCLPMMPASSNMVAWSLPNTACSLPSALMERLSAGSCRPLALM